MAEAEHVVSRTTQQNHAEIDVATRHVHALQGRLTIEAVLDQRVVRDGVGGLDGTVGSLMKVKNQSWWWAEVQPTPVFLCPMRNETCV